MKKIDLHLHVSPEAIYKNGKLFVSDPESMLAHMDELGIERGVLMSSGESPAALGSNDGNYAICTRYPDRFSWMCNVDSVAPETVYDRLAACKEQGAVGVGEIMLSRPIDDPFVQTVLESAEKLSLPVTFHMSPAVGFNYGLVDRPGLPLLEEALQRYPNLKFLGHSQVFWIEISGDAPTDDKGRNSWGKGPVTPGGTVPRLFEAHPNLYGDLSANSAGRAIMRDEAFGLAFLEKYADRLFFATDMLNAEMTLPLGPWLDEMANTGRLSQPAYEKITRTNAQSVFGL